MGYEVFSGGDLGGGPLEQRFGFRQRVAETDEAIAGKNPRLLALTGIADLAWLGKANLVA